MSLKLMYITNRPDVAAIAEKSGVDRIFVDMEYIGKQERQGGMDTVQSHHTIDDIKSIKKTLSTAQVMVRVNPIHNATADYCSSAEEIDDAINAGADILMLPYFKTADEVREFVRLVAGRAKTLPLVETREAAECIDEILEIDGIDEIYVGLNDLSLSMGKGFMFNLLSDGTVEALCEKFKKKGIPFGFGGIAALGKGMLPAEYVIREHYRLGSGCVILSRSFCNTELIGDIAEVEKIFAHGVAAIRQLEKECEKQDLGYFIENQKEVAKRINLISKK